jgi:hypothetical protein
MSEQYLQATHIPVRIYKAQGAAQSETLPDWLSADYVDLHERVIEFVFHTISDSDLAQPDAIAHKYYGDSRWWWLVCTYNGIVNPMRDMYLGQRIRVPALHQAQMSMQSTPDPEKEDRRGQVVTLD